jgi:amino acid transporter
LSSEPKKNLTLFDSTCLIVGIIIGAGIFETAPAIAKASGSPVGMFALWIVGGFLSLCGALCYAELATAYPREGGDYVYLTRAYGRWAGFLFGWVQLIIARPGDIALMAFVFARYGARLLWPFLPAIDSRDPTLVAISERVVTLGLAAAAVVLLTLVNVAGVRQGKWTQNTLTVVKILGVVAILFLALFAPAPNDLGGAAGPAGNADAPVLTMVLAVALIRVLFTYGGWNEMAYVAAEVKNPKKNIVRALVLGTLAVTGIYLLMNAAFLHTLGFEGVAGSRAIGTDIGEAVLPRWGGRLVGVLICISALGAVNGLIFAGSRISYALGKDHELFRWMGQWSPRTGTPVGSLLTQAALAIALIIGFGSFNATILVTSVAVYSFYLATSLAVIVLRWREPGVERPYRVTGYPVIPLVFAACCGLLIYGAWDYWPTAAHISASILLAGLPIYWVSTYAFGRPKS